MLDNAGCDGRLDIVLVVDGSSSIHRERFLLVLDFLADLVDRFEVGPNRTRVGAVVYGNGSAAPLVEFRLRDFRSKRDVIVAVERMPFVGGPSRLSPALTYLVNSTMIYFDISIIKMSRRIYLLKSAETRYR